jgi:hypothetical protein
MGDRGAKRRAAVRDAVRVADERYATGTHALVQVPPSQNPQTIHESVSEIVPTKMSTGVKDDLLRATSVTSHQGIPSAPPSSASGQWAAEGSQPEPHGTTDQPVMVHAPLTASRSRAGLFVGVGLSLAAALVAGAVILRPGAAPPPPKVATQPPPAAPSVAPVAPVAPVTASATPTAAASGVPAPSAVAVNSLPDAPDDPKKVATTRVPGPMPGATGKASEPKSDPKPEADKPADKPTKKVSTDKVPIFTNPGF